MKNNEIKPSFGLKYLLLTVLAGVIIYGIGFGISKVFEFRSRKELTVANGYLINLINDTFLPKEQFDVGYYLKGKTRTKLSSIFIKKVFIKNTGNEGVEDLKITAVLKGDDIQLVATPQIKTMPEEVIDTIEVKKIVKALIKNMYGMFHYLTLENQ